jgi:TRAP-type C4-dicarboxylate transport system substrate-binding protein
LELLDEDFVAAWWADLSPRERRAVQEIVSERLYRLEVEWVKGEGRQEEKVLDNVMAGREWYRMRRRVASELIAKETDLAEMIYQAEMSNYE